MGEGSLREVSKYAAAPLVGGVADEFPFRRAEKRESENGVQLVSCAATARCSRQVCGGMAKPFGSHKSQLINMY